MAFAVLISIDSLNFSKVLCSVVKAAISFGVASWFFEIIFIKSTLILISSLLFDSNIEDGLSLILGRYLLPVGRSH